MQRVYPSSQPLSDNAYSIHAARNERVSLQACIRNTAADQMVSADLSASGPDGLGVQIRRVGYVPIKHLNTDTPRSELDGVDKIPGLVPDPLFQESTVSAGPLETNSFWVNVSIPADVEPGEKEIRLTFKIGEEVAAELSAKVIVSSIVVQPRTGFPVTHWFHADALCDWYKLEPWEDRFWEIVGTYIEDLISHGNNCVYVPIFTPPTDGVKRPTQLLKVSTPTEGKYSFDFSYVRKWVRLALDCGAEYFEWTHLFSQWGVKNAIRIYRSNQDRESLLWPADTAATSDVYRNFLAQFLPAFHEFLLTEGIFEQSFFHLSDEPHGEQIVDYRAARAVLAELAPWMKVMDALSDVAYAVEGLTDIPIPSIGAARDFKAAGVSAWAYFCCGPRGAYLNRLIDTPLAKIRMSGWLFYRLRARGFLHWGYNYWYKSQTQQMIDPFSESAGGVWPGWPHGDAFVVYPGADGPVDSIRWEMFGESLRDYALLQTVGIDPDDALLSELNDYNDFPKTEDWITETRHQILM